MSVLTPNWLDQLILHGRDPYKPTILLRTVRLQAAFALSLLIIVMYGGFLWWSAQQRARDDCDQRNARTVLSTKVLEQLTAASRADGDRNAALVWQAWTDASRQTPLPRC